MFDRIPSTNSHGSRTPVPAKVTLDDGSIVSGSFLILGHADIASFLNADRSFVSFVLGDGTETILSKQAIRRVDPINVAKTRQLDNAMKASDRFDPHQILGVSRDAAPDAVRAAYRDQVRAYHPDRIAAYNLPKEMTEYSAAMLSRINAAYDMLDVSRKTEATLHQ